MVARQFFGEPWSIATLTAAFAGSLSALTAAFGGKPLSAFYSRYSRPWNTFGRRSSTSRQFNLIVTSRSFDHARGELTLTAASGEVLLHSDALVAASPFDPATTSVRGIVVQLLDRVGATLQAGEADATITVESTIWTPGVSAWDYIAPLLQASNLKLWCDEIGRWSLTGVHPASAGNIVLTPTATITALSDTMEIDGEDWFDAVVVIYKWTDAFDLNQVAYDVAGASNPRNVSHIEYNNTPYPGPGAAAGILNRAKGRGRVLDVRAISDYRAQPGQPATITPPDTDAQTGYLSAVTFEWPANEMSVASRGLVDTPDTAYLFGPAGVSYLDVPEGISYTEFEWSMV
jgi:hypothetical protein